MSPNVYLPPPVACERLETIVARAGGGWSASLSGTQLEYVLPRAASAEIVELFRPLTSVIFGPDFIAHLPQGRVFGPGAVISPDGRSIARDVSFDFGKPFQDHWLLTFQKIRPPIPIPGETAVVATALASGYSHWLLEELPRLLALGESAFTNMIAHVGSPFSAEALKLLNLSATVIPARRYSHFVCERLVVPSLVGQPGFPTPKALDLLEEFTAKIRTADVVCGERLYVSRAKAQRRRVTNEAELWSLLQAHGFVKVCTEDLSWSEQIECFREAKVVVAPHGAGLANLAFCAPGTKVIELFNRSYVNGCYWRLAAVKDLDYFPLVDSGSERLGVDLRANRLDLAADLAQVAAALSNT
ncbi:MAG: glycosyltransferase family 61 protein [Opitutus sp.]